MTATLIPKRSFKDITPALKKQVLAELKAGRSVIATSRLLGMSDKHVTKIRDMAKIPAKKDGKGTTATPEPKSK